MKCPLGVNPSARTSFVRRNASEKHYVAASRVLVLVVSLLGAGFSFVLGSVKMGWQLVMELSGGIGLVELKHWLGEQPREERQTMPKQRLAPRPGSIDFLIFDCAPGWDLLSVNILVAASEVLCPVSLQGPALEGLKTFFRYLQSVQKLNPELRLKYVLPTMFDRRTAHTQLMLTQLERYFARQLCSPVHYTVRLSEAPTQGRTIFEYDRASPAARDYDLLVRRVMDDGDETTPPA